MLDELDVILDSEDAGTSNEIVCRLLAPMELNSIAGGNEYDQWCVFWHCSYDQGINHDYFQLWGDYTQT